MKHYYGILRYFRDGSFRVLPTRTLKYAEELLPLVSSPDEPSWIICSVEPMKEVEM